MLDRRAIQELIAELKSVRSPVQRMRILARAWNTVRELSSEERRELASRIGMKEITGLMERLGLKQDFVSDAVIDEVLEIEQQPEEVAEAVDEATPVSDVVAAPTEIEPEPVAKTPEPEPVEDEVKPAPMITMVEPEPAPPQPEPIAEAAEPEPPTKMTPPPADPLPRELLKTPSLAVRFRLLRNRLDDPAGAGRLPLEVVVECFPEGWARRRALSMVFRANLPDSADRALAMIEGLPRRSDQRWCAGVLADSRRLTGDETRNLLERFPSPVLRRRLLARIDLLS